VDRVASAPLKTAVGADSISARDVYGGAGFAGAYRMRPYVFVCAPKAQIPPSLLFIIFYLLFEERLTIKSQAPKQNFREKF